MNLPIIPNKKTIKVLVTTIKEVEINFPYVTFDSFINTYYYNYKENSCIVISDNRIEHYKNINSGLDQPVKTRGSIQTNGPNNFDNNRSTQQIINNK